MLFSLFRNSRFFDDLWALSPWFTLAFIVFLASSLPVIPDKHKPLLWLAAALCTLIGFITR